MGGENGTALVDNPKVDGPLFRVFGTYADVTDEDASQSPSPGENLATASRSRTFPDMAQVLAGNTNALTGQCPAAPPDDPDSTSSCRSRSSTATRSSSPIGRLRRHRRHQPEAAGHALPAHGARRRPGRRRRTATTT